MFQTEKTERLDMGYEKIIEDENKIIKFENDVRGKTVMASQHYHDVFEIYFLEYGNCSYFIDDKSYDVAEGDLILIPQGTIHKTMYGEGNHSRKLIYCSSHFIPTSVAEIIPSMLYHYRNPAIKDKIRSIFADIENEYNNQDEFSLDAIMNHIHLLFYLLARNRTNSEPVQNNKIYITQAINYIKNNYQSAVYLSDIAKMFSVSAEHLSRVFKKETGFGFNEYLTMLRLKKAETILKNNKKISISEVAYSCGFNDSNYFSDKFKKTYGISPIKYRNK